MNWQAYWDQQAKLPDFHAQVARKSDRIPVDDLLLDYIADHIAMRLKLGPDDRLLDAGCGNGQLSKRLARKCKEVVGVDLSPELIRKARRHHGADNIYYQVGEITRLSNLLNGPFDKINLYYTFQYLDSFRKGQAAMREMSYLIRPHGLIFLGDVPDRRKLDTFFPSPVQRLRYQLQQSFGGSESGRFWKENDIRKLAHEQWITVEVCPQPKDLPFADHRMDYLLEKR
ncbi:MAG: methyltransferase domain-containing protein [Bacteroidota bacterium]